MNWNAFTLKLISYRRDHETGYTLGEVWEDESNDEGHDEEIQNIIGKKRKSQRVKKRPGRKAQWPESLLTDMVDIMVTNDYFKKKFIFTNSKTKEWRGVPKGIE